MEKRSNKDIYEERVDVYNVLLDAQLKFLDKEKGGYAEEFIESRACPVCNEDQPQHMFVKRLGTYVKCKNCTMVYLNPALTDDALEEHYKSNNDLQATLVDGDLSFYYNIYGKGLALVEEKGKIFKGKVLDIGCSSGVFLDVAQKSNWSTYGLELNVKEAEMAKKKNHTIYTEMIENVTFDTKFDLITMWDVFEHIKDGFNFLSNLKEYLNDQGLVFMQIPSSDALAAKIMQEKCNMFDGIEHVNLYNYKTILIMIEKAGFELMGIQTVIGEVSVLNNFLNFDNAYTGESQNREEIPNLITEKQIHDSLQGYKFQLVIKKK